MKPKNAAEEILMQLAQAKPEKQVEVDMTPPRRKYLAAYAQDGSISHYLDCCHTNSAEQTPPVGGGFVSLEAHPGDIDAHAAAHYVVEGALTPKNTMAIAVDKIAISSDGKDEAKITGVPPGALVRIGGAVNAGPLKVDDGEIIITSNKPGRITCVLTLEPSHLEWSVDLDAH